MESGHIKQILVVGCSVKQGKLHIESTFGDIFTKKNSNIYETDGLRFIFTTIERLNQNPRRDLFIDHAIVDVNVTLGQYSECILPLLRKDAEYSLLD